MGTLCGTLTGSHLYLDAGGLVMKNISLDSAYLLFTLKKLNLYVHTGQLLAHHPDPHFDRRSDDGDAAVVLQGSKEI